MEINNRLRRVAASKKALGLRMNPFQIRATEDEQTLAKVFVDRDEQIDDLVLLTGENRNALLYGFYGIGKTALLKHFLFQAARARERGIASAYVPFVGRNHRDFLNAVAYAVAKLFRGADREAGELYNRMRGVERSKVVGKEIRGKAEGGISHLFKLEGEGRYTSTAGETVSVELTPPYQADTVKGILERMSKQFYGILIGVDEVDKKSPRDFNELIADARYLLNCEASFIITGAYSFIPLAGTVISEQYGAFEKKIEVPTMTEEELVEMAERYCSLAGGNPFDEEALRALAAQSHGVPRAMIVLCGGAIDTALKRGAKKITEKDLPSALVEIGQNVYSSLTPAQRKIADYIFERGTKLEAVSTRVAEELKLDTSTIYDHISALMSKDALLETSRNGERVWRINPVVSAYLKKHKPKKESGKP